MSLSRFLPGMAAPLIVALVAGPVLAQEPSGPRPYHVGNPLGLPVTPVGDEPFQAMSSNVEVYGAIYWACGIGRGNGQVSSSRGTVASIPRRAPLIDSTGSTGISARRPRNGIASTCCPGLRPSLSRTSLGITI